MNWQSTSHRYNAAGGQASQASFVVCNNFETVLVAIPRRTLAGLGAGFTPTAEGGFRETGAALTTIMRVVRGQRKRQVTALPAKRLAISWAQGKPEWAARQVDPCRLKGGAIGKRICMRPALLA